MSDDMTVESEADGSTRLAGNARASEMTLFNLQDRAMVRAAADQFVSVVAMLVAKTPLADDDVLDDMTGEEYARACGEVVMLTAQGLAHVVKEVFGDLTDSISVTMPIGDGREATIALGPET